LWSGTNREIMTNRRESARKPGLTQSLLIHKSYWDTYWKTAGGIARFSHCLCEKLGLRPAPQATRPSNQWLLSRTQGGFTPSPMPQVIYILFTT